MKFISFCSLFDSNALMTFLRVICAALYSMGFSLIYNSFFFWRASWNDRFVICFVCVASLKRLILEKLVFYFPLKWFIMLNHDIQQLTHFWRLTNMWFSSSVYFLSIFTLNSSNSNILAFSSSRFSILFICSSNLLLISSLVVFVSYLS